MVKRVDANQRVIVETLRMVGASVIVMSQAGQGFPDLVVGYRGQTFLLDAKNPATWYGRRGLNRKQQELADEWRGGPIVAVHSADHALRVIGAV